MTEREIELREEFGDETFEGTYKYLQELKAMNRKAFNKINKKGRKFSDNIMKILK